MSATSSHACDDRTYGPEVTGSLMPAKHQPLQPDATLKFCCLIDREQPQQQQQQQQQLLQARPACLQCSITSELEACSNEFGLIHAADAMPAFPSQQQQAMYDLKASLQQLEVTMLADEAEDMRLHAIVAACSPDKLLSALDVFLSTTVKQQQDVNGSALLAAATAASPACPSSADSTSDSQQQDQEQEQRQQSAFQSLADVYTPAVGSYGAASAVAVANSIIANNQSLPTWRTCSPDQCMLTPQTLDGLNQLKPNSSSSNCGTLPLPLLAAMAPDTYCGLPESGAPYMEGSTTSNNGSGGSSGTKAVTSATAATASLLAQQWRPGALEQQQQLLPAEPYSRQQLSCCLGPTATAAATVGTTRVHHAGAAEQQQQRRQQKQQCSRKRRASAMLQLHPSRRDQRATCELSQQQQQQQQECSHRQLAAAAASSRCHEEPVSPTAAAAAAAAAALRRVYGSSNGAWRQQQQQAQPSAQPSILSMAMEFMHCVDIGY